MTEAQNSSMLAQTRTEINNLRDVPTAQSDVKTRVETAVGRLLAVAEEIKPLLGQLADVKTELDETTKAQDANTEVVNTAYKNISRFGDEGRLFEQAKAQLGQANNGMTNIGGVINHVGTGLEDVQAQFTGLDEKLREFASTLQQSGETSDTAQNMVGNAVTSLNNYVAAAG
jgi:chromosome segregation ATPase